MKFVKITRHCHIAGIPVTEGQIVEVDDADLSNLVPHKAIVVDPPAKKPAPDPVEAEDVQGDAGPTPENREADLEKKITKRKTGTRRKKAK